MMVACPVSSCDEGTENGRRDPPNVYVYLSRVASAECGRR